MKSGLYIHVPFCLHKCPYCDFYSVPYNEETAESYVRAVINSFKSFPDSDIDTIYFGGGTPSLLTPSQIERLIYSAAGRFKLCDSSEITMECNPATADREKLSSFFKAGVNRLSIGIQSLNDIVLRESGRIHSSGEAVQIIIDAFESGFDNISIDLMMGLPGDTLESFLTTLSSAASLPITHISAYMLKLMPGTPFGTNPPKNIADDDLLALMYERCCEYLETRGFVQYEISNFSLPGFESRHNLKYWLQQPYIGTGAAAHGCINRQRYSFAPDLYSFIDLFEDNCPDYNLVTKFEGFSDITDYIMLRLRTTKGISFVDLYKTYNYSFDNHRLDFINACVNGNLAEINGDTFRLTSKGFLVSNEIIARLI